MELRRQGYKNLHKTYLRNDDAPVRLAVLLVLLSLPNHALLPQLHPFDGRILLPVLGQIKLEGRKEGGRENQL